MGNAVTDFGPKYKDVTDAVARFRKGDVAGARGALVSAKDKHPALAPARIMLARLMLSVSKFADSRIELEREAAVNPNDPESYLMLADLALRDRRSTEAEALLEQSRGLAAKFTGNAKRKKSIDAGISAGLAAVAEQREMWPAAVEHLTAWVGIEPANAVALMRLGQAQFRAGHPAEATKSLRAAAKADPELLSADIVLGKLFEDAGDEKNAETHMSQAVKAGPQELNTLLAAAQWALRNNRIDVAKTRAEAALKLDPTSLDAQLLCGQAALFAGDMKTAEQYFSGAHLQSPANFQAANLLGLALIDQDDALKKRRALEFAELTANLNPRNSEATETLGWVYFKLGRTADADRVLGTVINSGSLSADGAYYTARLFEGLGRADDARKWAEKALQGKRAFAHRRDAEALMASLTAAKKPAKPDKDGKVDDNVTKTDDKTAKPGTPATRPEDKKSGKK